MDRFEQRSTLYHRGEASGHEREVEPEPLGLELLDLDLHDLARLRPAASDVSKRQVSGAQLGAEAVDAVEDIDGFVDVGGRRHGLDRIVRLPYVTQAIEVRVEAL